LADFDSPSGSKENAEPEQPFSGGRKGRMSPGFSPLGRRPRRGAGEEAQAPGSLRRRLAQRSLLFGGPSDAEVERHPLKACCTRGEGGGGSERLAQRSLLFGRLSNAEVERHPLGHVGREG